jgi:hypothetical protein
MPLAFQTLNRGAVAFGFFNIDTDLLLMDRFFLFAPEFCGYIEDLAGHDGLSTFEANWDVDVIEEPAEVGDLMGAIHNVRHRGFIGEVYRRYPFPSAPEDFRQKPEGHTTREEIREILDRFAAPSVIRFVADPRPGGGVTIGPFHFSREVFHELVQYVWLGGYPRWRDMNRPRYVSSMIREVARSRNPVFREFVPE